MRKSQPFVEFEDAHRPSLRARERAELRLERVGGEARLHFAQNGETADP
jgi:hypothetical protein